MLLEKLLSVFGIRIKEAFDVGFAWVIGFLSLRQHPVPCLDAERHRVIAVTDWIQKFDCVMDDWQHL